MDPVNTSRVEGGCGGTYSNTELGVGGSNHSTELGCGGSKPNSGIGWGGDPPPTLLYSHSELEECRNSTLELAALKIEELYKSTSASGFKSLSLRNTSIMYAKAIRAMKFTK